MDGRIRPQGNSFADTVKKDRPWVVMGVAVVAVILLIGGVKACSIFTMMKGMQQAEPHATVTSMKAGYQEWHTTLDAIGSVHPVRGADLSTELSGVVDAINFRSGQEVKGGDVILQLHAASERAQYDLARTNLERAKAQNALKLISKADYDSALAQYEAAKASGDKKSIRAPFAGQLGLIVVTVGQFVNPGDRMVTLQALDPIYVDFTLPQQALSQIAPGQTVAATVDAYPSTAFTGTIEALDSKVDERTRNVAVRATFPNPDHKLLPGMFANVDVDVGQAQKYLTLPQTAVTFNPYGETVYVVVPRGQENAPDPNAPPEARQQTPPGSGDAGKKADQPADNTRVARQVFVQVGPKRGDQIAILKGVKEGDEIVTSGQLKLRNGMPVDVDNAVQPTFDPNPTPQEQ